jgi:hypothetical protein
LEKQRNQGSGECSLLRITSLNTQGNCGLSNGRINATIIMKNGDINIQQICSCDNLANFSQSRSQVEFFGQLIQKI